MIELTPARQEQLMASLKRYLQEEFEIDMGDLKSQLMLDFMLQELGPAVYNQAIQDAQAYFIEKTTDIEAVLWEPEASYWENSSST